MAQTSKSKSTKTRKHSRLDLYRVHDESKIGCPACIVNGTSRSVKLLIPGHESLREKYIEYSRAHRLDELLISSSLPILELSSSINRHVEYLSVSVLDKASDFTAYALMARLVIEKLALLNFIVESVDRQEKLKEIYEGSVLDIAALAESKPYDNPTEAWLSDNKWTTSDMISRIEALEVDDARFVYSYTSRIAHAVNRDASMRSDYDMYHVKVYLLIVLSKIYNSTFVKLLRSDNTKSCRLKELHIEMLEDTDRIWTDLHIMPQNLLRLTTFVHYYAKKPKVVSQFITRYKVDLVGSTRSRLCRPVEYVDLKESGPNIHGTGEL